MSYTEETVLTIIRRLNRRELRFWMREGWVRPAMSEAGPVFDEVDVARLRLLCDLRKEMALPTDAVPVVDGHALRDVLQEWSIRHVQSEMPGFFNNARTVVLGGLNHDRTTRILREYTDNLEFADPLLRLDAVSVSSCDRIQALLTVEPIDGAAAVTKE